MTEHSDLIVIGGGIHGVGVAQAAAARGYSVLLLEQAALASATSSRSSGLIHGGLRYLEHGQFALVRECLRERQLLLSLAPDLVQLRPFYIPVYRDTRRRPWQLRLGLGLYALFGRLDTAARFQSVPRAQWPTLDGLATIELQAVFRYWDAQTDDAALTRAVMDSARSLGARLSMPSTFIGARVDERGCTIHYRHGGTDHTCSARLLVNAAGPWVNDVLGRVIPPPTQLPIELVQGTHIVIKGELVQGVYYLEAPQDRRAVFAIPSSGKIVVGTTENAYQGDPAAVTPLEKEKEYLLAVLSHYFPGFRTLQIEDIVEAFTGLRVLPAGAGSSFARSRDTLLQVDRPDRPKVLTIYGGKLTAYRATAEKVMDRLVSSLPARQAIADTRALVLKP